MDEPDAPSLPFVVVVSGAPGSGKTTLGWELSRRLHVPFLSRDDIKTSLHVTHRSDDPADVWRFSSGAFDIFYDMARTLLTSRVSIVIEAAFHAEHCQSDLRTLSDLATVVHLMLDTPCDLSLQRYRARAEAGERHPAHNDLAFAAQMEAGVKDVGIYRLDLPYPTLVIDGSNGWRPDLDAIAAFVALHRR